MSKRPDTDEEMAALRVSGTVTPHNGPISLLPYDFEWPAQYAREEAKIRAALGAGAVVLEHVGSTSIPGMSAKPIIDILLAVVRFRRRVELRSPTHTARVSAALARAVVGAAPRLER